MFKKLSIVFILGLAYGVILGHDIIAHHHDDDAMITSLQDHHGGENENDEHKDLAHFFSHFQHYDKKGFFYIQGHDKPIDSKCGPHLVWFKQTNVDLIPQVLSFQFINVEKPVHYYSLLSSSGCLRGPPCLS